MDFTQIYNAQHACRLSTPLRIAHTVCLATKVQNRQKTLGKLFELFVTFYEE